MQQPMNTSEPIGGQQAMTQQMVLCPVRFVYETQVLVQPGDQITPNQTFFLNPQNTPPWMQNRPAAQPNQVVYVQQMPNNMVHTVQQHMDQNQLYLQQNFANFQLQQHMLAQNQEMRPGMQLANIVPNMVQTVQQNIQQNIQNNERNVSQNTTMQMQANTQQIQNQINVRQIQNPSNQNVELQRHLLMNTRPQMNQQMHIARPVMSLGQFQNLGNMQNVQIQNTNNVGPFMQQIGQRPHPQNVNAVRPQLVTNNVMNVQPMQPVAKVREIPPAEVNKPMSNTVVPPVSTVPNVRNFAQNYNCKPIQPRRRYPENSAPVQKMQPQHVQVQTAQAQHIMPNQTAQVQHNMPNQTAQAQHNMPNQTAPTQHNIPVQTAPTQHIPVQTAPTQYNPEKSNSHQMVTNIAANTTFLNNPNVSRKRKSESPDEIQNKMPAQPMQPIYKNLQQGIIITKLCNEIGTNTSPVHKPNLNVNNPPFQMNSNPQMMMVDKTEQIDPNLNKNITEARPVNTPVQSESDKLIRNTVYTQARGRLLQDKISENVIQTPPQPQPQAIENKAPGNVQNITEKTITTEVQTQVVPMITEAQTEKAKTVTEAQSEKPTTVKPETGLSKNIETIESNPKTVVPEPEQVIKEIKIEKKESNVNKQTSVVKEDNIEEKAVEQVSEVKDEKVELTDKIVTKQDILTHVVDGYVIQESNFAFPIRKPLKEKTLYANSKAESESTDALKECMKEEMKNTAVDVQLLPFHYLLLHCEKKIEEEEKTESGKPTPFSDLSHTTVKSWTVEDLSSHLLKFDWKDTASVFQDHEIDGESLFLVSKTQLVSIGVTEENADAICDYVKS